MALNLFPLKINLADKLRTGFRVKYNLAVDKIIKDCIPTEIGFNLVTHDDTLIEVDLTPYFYDKATIDDLFFISYATEEEAGKIRIGTMEEIFEGVDDSVVVTPYKLSMLLLYLNGRGVVPGEGEEFEVGDMVYLVPQEEPSEPVEGEPFFPKMIAYKALATTLATAAVGFVEFIEDDAIFVKFSGSINTNYSELKVGQYYFLSDEDPGKIVLTPPQAPGAVQQIVGYAISDLELMTEIHKPYLNWADVFIPEFPSLYFEVGRDSSYSILLTDYLSEYNVVEEQIDEEEDPKIVTGYSYRFLTLPEWVTSHSVVFDYMTIGGKPVKVGKTPVFLEVTDRDKRTYLHEMYLYVAPKTKIKFTLRDTSGIDPVDVAEIFNGAGFLKPEFDFDVKVTVSGRHDGWFGKLTTPSSEIIQTTDPYDLVETAEAATYIIGENVLAEIGFNTIDFALFRNIGDPDNLQLIEQESVKFMFYDEELLAKAQFFLWDSVNDVEIGPINPDGSSKFDVTGPWDVRCNIDDLMHDEGLSIMSNAVDPEVARFHYFLVTAEPLATYHQINEIVEDQEPGLYSILLELFLTDQVTTVRDKVYSRGISFTINEKGVQPVSGVLKLGTVPKNTTNFNLIDELPETGGSYALPTDSWSVMNDSESPLFNSDEWVLYRYIDQLVNIDISVYTGNPQVNTYAAEGITQVESRLFGKLGSKDIGNPSIHKTPSTWRVINRRRMDGVVVAVYEADFSFGPAVPIDGVPIGGPSTGTGGIVLKSGNGIFIAVDDEYNTVNVLADPDEFEFDDDPLAKTMHLKAGGITLVHMDELPSLTVIGNMTAGVATPSAVSVLTSTTLAGASHTNLATTLAVKTYVDNTLTTVISGTANFFAKFITPSTLGVGILSESGINVNATGNYISSVAPNVNPRGFYLANASGVTRWTVAKSGTESGDGTNGSDLTFGRYNDSGGFLGFVVTVSRATGLMSLFGTLTVGGSGVVISTTSTTLNPNFNADLLDSQHGTYYLDRTNHTGTQLAATISDFAAAVRAVPLTGLVTTTNSAILATDSILVAFGKVQAQINAHTTSIGTGIVDYFALYTGTATLGTAGFFRSGTSVVNGGHYIVRNADNTNVQGMYLQNAGGLARWGIGKAGTEPGTGNGGSDYVLWAFDDLGSYNGEALRVTRSTKLMSLFGTLTIGGSGVVISTTSTTLNPNFNADLLDSQHGVYYLDRTNHTGTQLAATISDFAAAVRAVPLTGLSVVTGSAVVATDTILQAFGKLQGQINTVTTGIGSGTVNFFPYYNTTTTFATSILSQVGIAITANAGVFVSDTAMNTNVRGYSVWAGGVARWTIGKAGTETGSGDTGSDWTLWGYTDAGAFKAEPMRISRATMLMTLSGTLTIGGSGVVISTTSTTLNPNFNADLLDSQHGTYYLDRTNHTGTQLASTISNFSAATLAVALTGLSTATNSPILATDTILQAFGKLQAQLTGVGGSISAGTVDYFAKYTGTTTIGIGGLYASGTAVINGGHYISDTAHNVNVTGFYMRASGVSRWGMGKAGTETGVSNAGSDWVLWSFSDAGSFTGEAVRVYRDTRLMWLAGTLTINGSGVVISTTSTTLNPNFNSDLLDSQHGSYYLSRTNHTGTQAISTVTGLQTALDAKASGSGTTDTIVKYTGSLTLGNSIMTEVVGAIIVAGQLFSDVAHNSNVRGFSYRASGTNRWSVGKAGTETGSGDAGSDYVAWSYTDGGSFLREHFRMVRATGATTFAGTLTVSGGNSTNWNTAYGWGNHAGLYAAVSHTHSISQVTGLQSALDGKVGNWGNGVDNRFALWINSGQSIGNSNLYYNSGNIGVGVNPGYPLDVNGGMRINAQITSTLASGTSPFSITSTTLNTNLNADMLDGNHASAFALSSHTHTASNITDFTSAARGTLSAGSGISYNSSTGVISFSGSSGISGSGTNTYFGVWTGSSSMGTSVVRDTGSEINVGSGRSFGVEGPAALRDYLHVWGYQANGTASNHGTLILHNLSSATINGSAAIEILSTTRGFLNARMTTAQRQAISSPAAGLQVFQTDGGAGGLGLYVHIGGGSWIRVTWDYIGA